MNALSVFVRVIFALIKREARTRNGKMRFGYVWAFLEPALYLGGFVAFRSFLRSSVPFGENTIVYMLTAILTFRIAMALSRRTLGAIHSNMALLTYPQVKTFDVIFSRILLETATWLIITCVFVSGLFFVTDIWPMQRPEEFLSGLGATFFFGASFGFFNATFVRLFPFWEKIMAMLSLPLFFISGLFFLPSTFPPDIQGWLWWNPYLHAVEWVRSGVYLDYAPFLSKSYLLTLSLIFLFLGLFINRFFQRKMLEE